MPRRLRPPLWVIIGLGMLVLAGSAAAAVSKLEEDDRFCISCHTAPEVAYYERVLAVAADAAHAQVPPDLSSAHTRWVEDGFRCIDCHRGNAGAVHRATTLALGARDAALFLSGQADPTLEKGTMALPALASAACTRCHTDALLITGFGNHFHNKLPEAYEAWRAGGELVTPPDGTLIDALAQVETTVSCVDCHRAHVQAPGAEAQGYLDLESVVLPACVQCHREVGHGPLEELLET